MTTPYQRGANFERRVRAFLQKNGYLCWRVAGSKGEGGVDLLAFGKGAWGLIQCKIDGRINETEKNVLITAAKKCSAFASVAVKDGRRIGFRCLSMPCGCD